MLTVRYVSECLCYGALAHCLSRQGELKPACVLEPFTLSRSKSDLKLPPESGFCKNQTPGDCSAYKRAIWFPSGLALFISITA